MRTCAYCARPLARRKERGHREREYCSDTCRQRASRQRNKDKHDLARIWQQAEERMANSIAQDIQREGWQDERHLLQTALDLANHQQALLECENAMLRTQLDFLEQDYEMVQTKITLLREGIANQTEELTQAHYLLDHPSRTK